MSPPASASDPKGVAVYTDYAYSRKNGAVYADRAFALFLGALGERLEHMVVIGRLRPDEGEARYRLPDDVEFVAMPFYESLASPLRAAGAMAKSLRRFWRTLDDVEACWLLGPHPLALAFTAIAAMRRRRVILGVRQDLKAYAAHRHPGRRSFRLAAGLLESAYRLLGRAYPVVVVGPELARQYRHGTSVLEIAVSLVPESRLAGPDARRDYAGAIRILSVGRIEAEKNPLLLADILARLRADGDDRWSLDVCGEGPLSDDLQARLDELGLGAHARLHGYVPHHGGMAAMYSNSHVLLHVSWTEGLPQVMIEATADQLPVVATDVGGIGDALGDAALLVPAGDARAAADGVRRVVSDLDLRDSLLNAGAEFARAHTLEAEIERLVRFIGRGEASAVADPTGREPGR